MNGGTVAFQQPVSATENKYSEILTDRYFFEKFQFKQLASGCGGDLISN